MLGVVTYLALLATLALGTLLRPAIGMAAVLCLFGLKQWGQTSTTFFVAHPLVTNLVIGMLVIAGIIRHSIRRSCVFCRFPTSAILVAVLYGYAFITTAWAIDPQTSLSEWVRLGPYIVTVTLLAPLLLSDLSDVRTAFQWTVYIGGAICLLALAFGKWGFRGLLLNGNIYETETNPLALASLGGAVLLAAATLMLQKKHMVQKVVNIACIPLALGGNSEERLSRPTIGDRPGVCGGMVDRVSIQKCLVAGNAAADCRFHRRAWLVGLPLS